VRRVVAAATVLLAASLAGCAKYHAHPLEPVASEEQFRARSLNDPGLRAFLNRANWPPDKLALNDLEAVAVYFSPDLDVARAQLRTAQAAIITAGAPPNPGLSTGGGYETDPESHLLFNFFPSFTVVTAGKRRWRILEAEKTADAARVAVEETAWRVRSRVRAAWLDYVFALRSLDVLRRESSLRSEVVEMLDKRVAAGETARPEADVARSALIAVHVAARAAEAQVNEAGAALAAAAGLAELPAIDTQALPPAPQSPPLAEVQKAGLLNRADVRRGLLEYAAADAALHLEIANQYPDLQYSPGYSYNEGFHQFTLGSSFNVPLLNRNRGPIAEAEAKRSEAEARFKALQTQAIGEMQVALAGYRGAQSELATAEDTYVRLENVREVDMQRAVRLGDQDRLALAGVRLDGVAAARARLDALHRLETALGALENALQHSLEGGPAVPDPMRKT
jgi:cobalt-zinc-cadmium efflux system outer membrane protein